MISGAINFKLVFHKFPEHLLNSTAKPDLDLFVRCIACHFQELDIVLHMYITELVDLRPPSQN